MDNNTNADYKIIEAVEGTDLIVGEVVSLSVEEGDKLVEEGKAEKVVAPEPEKPTVAPLASDPALAADEKASYKILAPIEFKDGQGQVQGEYQPDTVVSLPVSVGDIYVDEGRAEKVVAETEEESSEEQN